MGKILRNVLITNAETGEVELDVKGADLVMGIINLPEQDTIQCVSIFSTGINIQANAMQALEKLRLRTIFNNPMLGMMEISGLLKLTPEELDELSDEAKDNLRMKVNMTSTTEA